MKLALIPPHGLEHHMKQGGLVMSLAQFADDDEYTGVIRDMSSRGKFIIVDNGANEGASFSNQDLARRASKLRADELVLPDVLGDANETFKVASLYLDDVFNGDVTYLAAAPNYAGVVQGNSWDEVQMIVDRYSEIVPVKTVALPRLLLKTFGMRAIRIDIANWIETNYPGRFEVHLLGASTEWTREPYYVSRYATNVRSIDTSLPYNYGLKGIRIEFNGVTKEKVERPANYFTSTHAATALTTIYSNEEVYKSWCNAH